jgi:hypothetical protein
MNVGQTTKLTGRQKLERGSALIGAVISIAVSAFILASWSSRVVSDSVASRRYLMFNENLRVGEELAKIVSAAYERGKQLPGALCSSPNHRVTGTVTDFCFLDTSTLPSPNFCVDSQYFARHICLDLTSSASYIANTKDEVRFRFTASAHEAHRPSPFLNLSFLSNANAAVVNAAPVPGAVSQTYVTLDTAACNAAGAPLNCRKCSAGSDMVCFNIEFCPVEDSACATKTSLGVMIKR